MRLMKTFGLAALAAVVATAFVGATSASANFDTQVCKVHQLPEEGHLECPEGEEAKLVHFTLLEGTVGKLLSSLVDVLCLEALVHAIPLELGSPQNVHTLTSSYTGCGTGSAHSNCTVTVEEQPLGDLLKTGLDEGTLLLDSGRTRLVCSNLGIDCKYDTANVLFSAGGMMLTASETPTNELGGKFFCPDEGKLDGLLLDLLSHLSFILS